MELSDLIAIQRKFDERRTTTFNWSQSITPADTNALDHNVLSLAGEVGEIANIVKKYDRGDFAFDALMDALPGELADVTIYILKIAYQSGIDLERAVLQKIAINESRFPARKDDPEIAVDTLNEQERNLWKRAKQLATGNTDAAMQRLKGVYEDCGLQAPESPTAAYAGALLALRFSKAASFEGLPDARNHAWESVSTLADAVGLDRRGVATLTRRDLVLEHILSSDFTAATQGQGN